MLTRFYTVLVVYFEVIVNCSILLLFLYWFVTPGKFMVFLCNCLVKLAKNGSDDSDISVETDSQGL